MLERFLVINDLVSKSKCNEIITSINQMTFLEYIDESLSQMIAYQLSKIMKSDVFIPNKWYVKAYEPGEHMSVHMDGTKKHDNDSRRSFATLLLYLNDCKKGGETCFVDELSIYYLDPVITDCVKPVSGRVLVLRQDIPHMSKPTDEIKYILRNDVFLK